MFPDVVDSLPGIVDIVPVFVCSFPPDGGWKVLRENFPSAILHLLDWKSRMGWMWAEIWARTDFRLPQCVPTSPEFINFPQMEQPF